jgi:hypothetical protein
MKLKTIRDSFHARLLALRNVSYILNSDDFAIAYENAPDLEKKEILAAIERVDKKFLQKAVNTQLLKLTPFHRMTLRQLREVGRNTRIPEYWSKNKLTLISEIEDVVAKLKEGSK